MWFLETESLAVPVSRHPAGCQREEVVWGCSWERSLLLFLCKFMFFILTDYKGSASPCVDMNANEAPPSWKQEDPMVQCTKKRSLLKRCFLRWELFLSLLANVLSVLCKAFSIKERKSGVLHETLDFTLQSVSLSLGIYSCSSWEAPGKKVRVCVCTWGKIFQSAIRWWVYNCTVNLRADKFASHYSYFAYNFLHYILVPFLSMKRKIMGIIQVLSYHQQKGKSRTQASAPEGFCCMN